MIQLEQLAFLRLRMNKAKLENENADWDENGDDEIGRGGLSGSAEPQHAQPILSISAALLVALHGISTFKKYVQTFKVLLDRYDAMLKIT